MNQAAAASLAYPMSGEVIHLPERVDQDKTSSMKPPVGAFGVHDRYHLSTAEKHMLAQEVRDFLVGRFGGEPCPSCFTDVLMGAVGKQIMETITDPLLNSGTAQDFVERTKDWAYALEREHGRALQARREAIEFETRTGTFRNGKSTANRY